MKKRMVALCLAGFMLFAGAGCGIVNNDNSNENSDEGTVESSAEEGDDEASTENTSTEEASAEEASTENPDETASDGVIEEASADQNTSEGTAAGDAGSTEDTSAAGDSTASQTTIEVAAEDIVEPEIAQEEVTEPVATAQEAQPAEAPAQDDNILDIVFIGDSQFDNARDTGSAIPEYTCALFDNVRSYNLAIGGTAASLERGASPDINTITDNCFVTTCYALSGQLSDTSFLDKYPAGEVLKTVDPAKVDVYVIEYGANDYINGKDFWNPEDAYDIHTYKGALNTGVNVLKSISPNAKFVICGPSYCMWYGAQGQAIGDSFTVSKGIGTLAEYNDIAQNFADDEGFTYIDTMYATWFDLKNTTVDDYLSDGLHYKERGRQIYATTLAHFIKKTVGIDDGELPYLEINTFSFGK